MSLDDANVGSNTFPKQASALKKGDFIVVKDRPCKIIGMSTSKTGKHGAAKVHFEVTDIFSGKKYEEMVPSTHNVDVPNVKKDEYPLIDIDDEDFCSLMNKDDSIKSDIKLPEDGLDDEIRNVFENNENDREILVTVQCALNEEAIVSWRYLLEKGHKN
jgi:translation initiation factor 5A